MASRLRALRLVCLGAAWSIAAGAHAMTFAEAFQAALGHDALFRGAVHELEAARQNVPIARAGLLPSVNLSLSGADVSGSRTQTNALGQDFKTRLDYSAPRGSVSLRQPIFNWEARSRFKQAEAQADAAESTFRQRGLELIDRLGAAYLNVLLAHEGLRVAEVQVETLAAQLTQAQRRLDRGEGTRVDVATTQASLDVARVKVIEANDAIDLAHRELRKLTGVATPPLRRVPTDYVPAPLQPERLLDWLQLALDQSPSLRAREQALMAARFAVDRQYAGHLPRVDFVASVSRTQNESLANLNQKATLGSVGVELNMALFSGGGVDASVRQALAEQARAEEEIRNERETIELEVQKHHQAVVNGASRIAAYRQAVESSELALTGAKRSLEAGVGTNNEVVDATTRLYVAQRDLAQARIDYLMARLRLMLQAGTPMAEATEDLDRALVGVPMAARR